MTCQLISFFKIFVFVFVPTYNAICGDVAMIRSIISSRLIVLNNLVSTAIIIKFSNEISHKFDLSRVLINFNREKSLSHFTCVDIWSCLEISYLRLVNLQLFQ